MSKKLTLGLLLAFAAPVLFAVEIDTALLNTAKKVQYIEDKTSVSRRFYNTDKQIRDMGRTLGKSIQYQEQILKNPNPYEDGTPSYKYMALRIYSSNDKAGADIIYIGKSANVTTSGCLFRIISGYIEKAYDIPMKQADIIAEKVCWWNNNHYEDKNYFVTNFNSKVLDAFSDRTSVIGLAASWKYWPGRTRIIIPFVLFQKENSSVREPVQAGKADTKSRQSINQTNQTKESVKENMPQNYKILFGILLASAVLLVILLINVIMSIHKNKR
ncbi:MAG: hypothetical protein M0P01_09165 [Treponema sp.]|nr:hypothetical protein [Treponema sp.]